MLRQRLLAAVVVRNGIAVQSFGYERWLPLGKVTCLVQNLDRWGADGIIVLSTDRGQNGPDLELLQQLSALDLSTPLSYGGGIRNADDALQAVQAGAERLVIDRLLSDAPDKLADIAATVGSQALIASLPIYKHRDNALYHWQHWNRAKNSLDKWLTFRSWAMHVSEILAIDVKSEGTQQGYETKIIDAMETLKLPILAFGGMSSSDQLRIVLNKKAVAAAVIGNSLNYKEQRIHTLKSELSGLPLRPQPDLNSTANS